MSQIYLFLTMSILNTKMRTIWVSFFYVISV